MSVSSMKVSRIIFVGDQNIGVNQAIVNLTGNHQDTNGIYQFSSVELDSDNSVQIIGFDQLEKLQSMSSKLINSALGVVVMVDKSQPDSISKMLQQIKVCQPLIEQSALAIGVVQTQPESYFGLKQYNQKLREIQQPAPVFEVDVEQENDISMLLKAMLLTIDFNLENCA
ncbi:MAG: hypothetical protein OQK04_13315 [Kangiellaceae bacterium]|nr:hypothetical protein [Kangiellaceae bacterium]MCW8999681.1 hypothetical protein [Kangiellaceae bacterium]